MKILKLPEVSLLHKCEDVKEIGSELRLAVKEMVSLLKEENGLGLSAPQVGIQQRFFITRDKVFINPEILSIMGKKIYADEGCLSIPGAVVSVPRYYKIRMSYFDLEGVEHTQEFKGTEARILQHEFDHLLGKLITDYL